MKRGKYKRRLGQVSVFIIVAIVVVVGIIIFYLTSMKDTSSGLNRQFSSDVVVQAKFNQLMYSTQACIDMATTDALNVIGIQGGYYNKPAKYLDINGSFIPYYFYEDISYAPSISKVEEELGKAVDDSIIPCLEEVKTINLDFNLEYDKSKTSVNISQEGILFKVNLPIKISKEDRTMVVNLIDAPKTYDLPLYDILNLGKYMANLAKQDGKMVCLSCIAKEASDKSLYVDMVNLEDSSTLFVVSQNYTSSGEYSLEFINKYK